MVLSSHPVDKLIRELIETRRSVDPTEVERILDRIATAEFDTRLVPVESFERGIIYANRRLMAWDDSLFVHVVRRVVVDEQWAMGTANDQYLHDLHAAARADDSLLVVYARRGGSLAGVLVPTGRVIPAGRLGPDPLPELFVVYSTDKGIILSGYQVLSRDDLVIPEDARWLP